MFPIRSKLNKKYTTDTVSEYEYKNIIQTVTDKEDIIINIIGPEYDINKNYKDSELYIVNDNMIHFEYHKDNVFKENHNMFNMSTMNKICGKCKSKNSFRHQLMHILLKN